MIGQAGQTEEFEEIDPCKEEMSTQAAVNKINALLRYPVI
jgi:hypothetical protein